jgi:hypothetical protein
MKPIQEEVMEKKQAGRPLGPTKVSTSIRIRPVFDRIIRRIAKTAKVDYSTAVELLALEFDQKGKAKKNDDSGH